MPIQDAFAPEDRDTSPAARLSLIRENVRSRGHATEEELEWVIAQGTFPTILDIQRRELAARLREEAE